MAVESNSDLYATVEAIRAKLQRAGALEWSSALNDALHISSVPGEVLGETRLQLRRLQRSAIVSQLNLQEEIAKSLKYLDRILGP